jgi:branched-chain amino acid transport system permease protein
MIMDWAVFGQQVWYGLVAGATYVLFASGLSLIFGIMGVFNMAHGELYMLAAMLLGSLMSHLGMNFFLAAVICIACVGVIGLIINRLAIRPLIHVSPLTIFLSTIGASFIMLHGSIAAWGGTPIVIDAPFGKVLKVGGVRISQHSIMVLVVGAIAIGGIMLLLRRSKLGKQMRATAQNLTGASLIGINVQKVYAYTMLIASVLAALAGILVAPLLVAYPTMGQAVLIKGFCVVVVGGMASIKGAVIFGLSIGVLESLFGQYVSPLYRQVFIYGIMVVALLLKPEGLFKG